jgi:SulP family sulfate permease
VVISGAARPIQRALLTHGVRPPRVRFRKTLADAVDAAHEMAGALAA